MLLSAHTNTFFSRLLRCRVNQRLPALAEAANLLVGVERSQVKKSSELNQKNFTENLFKKLEQIKHNKRLLSDSKRPVWQFGVDSVKQNKATALLSATLSQ